jgi:hypothetical protein
MAGLKRRARGSQVEIGQRRRGHDAERHDAKDHNQRKNDKNRGGFKVRPAAIVRIVKNGRGRLFWHRLVLQRKVRHVVSLLLQPPSWKEKVPHVYRDCSRNLPCAQMQLVPS